MLHTFIDTCGLVNEGFDEDEGVILGEELMWGEGGGGLLLSGPLK